MSASSDAWKPEKPAAIYLNVPRRLLLVPGAALAVGLTIGLVRGSRTASLRFLAENVHRPPTTVQGWYFYNKTKNYRVALGALRDGARTGFGLGTAALGWVGIEEGLKWAGPPWEELSEVGAGLGTAVVFTVAYRLPWRTARRVLPLGVLTGGVMKGLSWSKVRLSGLRDAKAAEAEVASEAPTDVVGLGSESRPEQSIVEHNREHGR